MSLLTDNVADFAARSGPASHPLSDRLTDGAGAQFVGVVVTSLPDFNSSRSGLITARGWRSGDAAGAGDVDAHRLAVQVDQRTTALVRLETVSCCRAKGNPARRSLSGPPMVF